MARQMDIPPGNLAYLTGSTPFFALAADRRFSYALYVPSAHAKSVAPLPIVVIQHGTTRDAMEYRKAYAEAAELNGWIILTPLFPAELGDSEGLHNYKYIAHHGIRYDHVLLAMVAEVGEYFNADTDTFALHGFSGGGQFAHRFFYLHPSRLCAVSIGAPGHVTLLTEKRWWVGTGDFDDIFGRPVEIELMREVPVQMIVGGADVETWELKGEGGVHWMDGAQDAGQTRIERLESLRQSFTSQGVPVRFDLVDGVGHEGLRMAPTVIDFLTSSCRKLSGGRSEG